jgi:uncharacterized protein YcgL (UPF0745 family)
MPRKKMIQNKFKAQVMLDREQWNEFSEVLAGVRKTASESVRMMISTFVFCHRIAMREKNKVKGDIRSQGWALKGLKKAETLMGKASEIGYEEYFENVLNNWEMFVSTQK